MPNVGVTNKQNQRPDVNPFNLAGMNVFANTFIENRTAVRNGQLIADAILYIQIVGSMIYTVEGIEYEQFLQVVRNKDNGLPVAFLALRNFGNKIPVSGSVWSEIEIQDYLTKPVSGGFIETRIVNEGPK